MRLFDIDPRHMAIFGAVGAGADRPEIRFQHLQAYLRLLAKKGAAPATWPKGRDRGQCQQPGAKRHDRAMRRQIIGCRADRRCQQDAVADKLLDLVLAIDLNPDMRGVMRLAKQRDLVDRQLAMRGAVRPGYGHPQRMDRRCLGIANPLDKLVQGVMVH